MPSPGVTKRIIANAMKELMQERPLSKINVSDIVERCELNRNTFYYHFKDKYDLVNWIFNTEFMMELNKEVIGSDWAMIEHIFKFFYENQVFYANAFSITGQNSFSEHFAEMMTAVVIARYGEMFKEDEYHEFYITYFLDGLLATITRWLKDGAKIPPEKLTELIKTTITGTALKTLEEENGNKK